MVSAKMPPRPPPSYRMSRRRLRPRRMRRRRVRAARTCRAGALPCQCRSKDLVEAVVRRLPVESCTEARDVRDDSAHVARPPRRDAHRKCGAGCALHRLDHLAHGIAVAVAAIQRQAFPPATEMVRSEEHTSELQSLMRSSYAVFC